MVDPSTTALVPSSGPALPVPVFTGAQMAQALVAYKDLQRSLDEAMPDQIMPIGDREFRKKGYWRAVRLAFHVVIEVLTESRTSDGTFDDGRENFGWLVTYRATANGVSVPGDGSCFAVEKAERFRCPHPHPSWQGKSEHYPHDTCPDFDPDYRWRTLSPQATEHNVRSHAHTRAFNRAVSNLVGFGEVSAEEVDPAHDSPDGPDERPASRPSASRPAPRPVARPASTSPSPISEAQGRRLWAIATRAGWKEPEVHAYLLRAHHLEHVHEIPRDKYDAICAVLEAGIDAEGAS